MKIVLAIDSFKGCVSSLDAEASAASGIKGAFSGARVVSVPVSDGGEGFLEAWTAGKDFERVRVRARDPWMRERLVSYALSRDGRVAVVEAARVVGLNLVGIGERDPLRETSDGVGDVLRDAILGGARKIMVGLGGSATCDGGFGMLRAMGAVFLGETMASASMVDDLSFYRLVEGVHFMGLCDVSNPLYGRRGAAYVFGPQKGADARCVTLLDAGLRRFAAESGKDVDAHAAGSGAAGGIGFALRAWMGAGLVSGIDAVLDNGGFDDALQGADLVITGEGKADRQTLMGKAAYGILLRARKRGIPVALLAGQVEDAAALRGSGFEDVIGINDGADTGEAALNPDVAKRRIAAAAQRLARKFCGRGRR